MNSLKSKLDALPNFPGIYLFLNNAGKIIYVGKAKNLRKRVRSYFQKGRAFDNRLELLRREIADIDFVTAPSESEALVYEAALIKDNAPRFNIELKDDKSYPYLKLSVNERFPRLTVTRRKTADGALYYGPYTDVGALKEALFFMKKVFPLRTCAHVKKKVCLEYHIGQCAAPCENKISEKEYAKTVEDLKAFLEGRIKDLALSLKKEMAESSAARRYERSIEAKRRLEAVLSLQASRDQGKTPIYGELSELMSVLGLVVFPRAIECFDISNISGEKAVGSMVRFVEGRPDKKNYRHFRIRTFEGIDDYAMIKEVVERRYSRLVREGAALPDLVLIDGGKGHQSAAKEVLEKLGLGGLQVASIAKEFNHVYISDKKAPIRFSPGARVLLLIQRIRDEAHRFAVTYHRRLRDKI
ncbi:MAG: excinuclease ABC subunit UvrC [Candidatus Omnitrophica bacterium]|nr:excinuclease ABC subunit UvrC [Candidatus Omnitrophota bacterium]